MIGFLAWATLMGWVKEVCVSMMLVGHTHEDIDAIFKHVKEYWLKKGKVLNPTEFMQFLGEAIPDATVHPIVEYTHDWVAMFDKCIYDSVVGINSAREFIIKQRGDGAMLFWYKESSSHKHMYPAQKDVSGAPVQVTKDGDKTYAMCPHGLEIFTNRRGPVDLVPGLAFFAKDTVNKELPHFDTVAGKTMVDTRIMSFNMMT